MHHWRRIGSFITHIPDSSGGIEKIYAFDSFEGIKGVIPEEIGGPFKDGSYTASKNEYIQYLHKHKVNVNEISTFVGFFQDILNTQLQNQIVSECSNAAVIHIDCDIYEPALLALNFVEPMLIQGTIVLFDDWYSYALDPLKGEPRALNDFLNNNKHLSFTFWKDYGPVGKAFIVTIFPLNKVLTFSKFKF
jgi:hypothetical protein